MPKTADALACGRSGLAKRMGNEGIITKNCIVYHQSNNTKFNNTIM